MWCKIAVVYLLKWCQSFMSSNLCHLPYLINTSLSGWHENWNPHQATFRSSLQEINYHYASKSPNMQHHGQFMEKSEVNWWLKMRHTVWHSSLIQATEIADIPVVRNNHLGFLFNTGEFLSSLNFSGVLCINNTYYNTHAWNWLRQGRNPASWHHRCI